MIENRESRIKPLMFVTQSQIVLIQILSVILLLPDHTPPSVSYIKLS